MEDKILSLIKISRENSLFFEQFYNWKIITDNKHIEISNNSVSFKWFKSLFSNLN